MKKKAPFCDDKLQLLWHGPKTNGGDKEKLGKKGGILSFLAERKKSSRIRKIPWGTEESQGGW